MLDLLRRERGARIFFLAHAQSSFGTGAAYVALLIVAYERWPSPWAVAAVLLADLVPSAVLGPIMGAAADRWSRRTCLIVADVVRAAAFLGIALVDSFLATFLLAAVVGCGNALFHPTVMAAVPSMVARERVPAATSLFGFVGQLGHTAGPGLAALALLVASATPLLFVNGITFLLSAGALLAVTLRPTERDAAAPAPAGLLREAWAGVRAVADDRPVRVLLLSSSAFVLFLGMLDVGELLLARDALDLSDSQFSLLVGTMGCAIGVASLFGARRGGLGPLKRRYLAGLAVTGVGLLVAATASSFAVALAGFALTGIGNGLGLTHERLLLQRVVPDDRLGRVFGVKGALVAWSFALAFLAGGALLSLAGPRTLFAVAGIGALAATAAAWQALRGRWESDPDYAAAAVLEPSLASGSH